MGKRVDFSEVSFTVNGTTYQAERASAERLEAVKQYTDEPISLQGSIVVHAEINRAEMDAFLRDVCPPDFQAWADAEFERLVDRAMVAIADAFEAGRLPADQVPTVEQVRAKLREALDRAADETFYGPNGRPGPKP
jgi:hypothetical protein